MLRKILIAAGILLLIVMLFIYSRLQPSGDISKYETYYIDEIAEPDSSNVKVTYFGATTLLLDDGQTQILIDGFFSRPSLWKALTAEIKSDTALIDATITKYKMNKVKGIFVAHTHYDHAFDVAYTTNKTRATLLLGQQAAGSRQDAEFK